jgi:hypothetical protein
LPVRLSDTLRALRAQGLLSATIGAGACFGGELEAVNVYSALLLGRARADVAVCAVGPGVVGTATTFGHGGTAAADAVGASDRLGGQSVLAVRMSSGDPRGRHRGVSHHTLAVLKLVGASCRVAWPAGCPFEPPAGVEVDEVDASGWREACARLPLEHMSRGRDTDPWFFASTFAAGIVARELVGS